MPGYASIMMLIQIVNAHPNIQVSKLSEFGIALDHREKIWKKHWLIPPTTSSGRWTQRGSRNARACTREILSRSPEDTQSFKV